VLIGRGIIQLITERRISAAEMPTQGTRLPRLLPLAAMLSLNTFMTAFRISNHRISEANHASTRAPFLNYFKKRTPIREDLAWARLRRSL
jgi:hypothetical protein